jgi:hypothetical protein
MKSIIKYKYYLTALLGGGLLALTPMLIGLLNVSLPTWLSYTLLILGTVAVLSSGFVKDWIDKKTR